MWSLPCSSLPTGDKRAPGSCLFPHVTGSRPLIIEVQAICPKTAFSFPKKLSVGYEINRLLILVAVLEKSLSLPFFDRDVYVNITGGIKVSEPAADLAIAASILSTYKDVSWKDAAFFGEVGLTGEVRRVVNMDMRLRECERLHIKKIFCPAGTEETAGDRSSRSSTPPGTSSASALDSPDRLAIVISCQVLSTILDNNRATI